MGILDLKDDLKKGNIAKFDKRIDRMKKEMVEFATNLDFEKAARLRDQIKKLEDLRLS